MAILGLLLPALALAVIEISEPYDLGAHYQDYKVPSITANFGNPQMDSLLTGSVIFFPSVESPCESLAQSWSSSIIVLVSEVYCEYAQAAYMIQQAGAGGVIFYSIDNTTDISTLELNLPDDWNDTINIYVGMISKSESDYWDVYEDYDINIEIYSYYEARGIPDILIALTGDHELDNRFLSSIYKMMIPVEIETVNLTMVFKISSCYNCNTYDCYTSGKYCMVDSLNKASGQRMIDEAIFVSCLLDSIGNNSENYFGKFFDYLYSSITYCDLSYSEYCRNDIIDALGIDETWIQSCIDSSWQDLGNSQSDNYILKMHLEKWESLSLSSEPKIIINDQKFVGDIEVYFNSFFCGSFASEPLSCNISNECHNGCGLSKISDGVCDEECRVDECDYDAWDCRDEAPICTTALFYNDECDEVCNTAVYWYDNGMCVCTCEDSLLNNGICDSSCNKAICNYDNGSCLPKVCGCDETLLYNNLCDSLCNTAECDYDNYQCIEEEDVLEDGDGSESSIGTNGIIIVCSTVFGVLAIL